MAKNFIMPWKRLRNMQRANDFLITLNISVTLLPININEDKTQKIFASGNCQQVLNIYKAYYPKIGFHFPWIGYFILDNNVVVGSCGFTGKPQNGEVEIAYYTFKENEGKGIASFACKELITISKATDSSIIVTAKTSPEHNASAKILECNGFKFESIVQDEDIGDSWLWKLIE